MNFYDELKDVKKIKDGVLFEKSPYLKKALAIIIGLLTSNSPIIKFHPLFKNHDVISNKDSLEDLKNLVVEWVDKIVPKLEVFGFGFYNKDKDEIIEFLDFRDGKIKYKVDKKTKKRELFWVWHGEILDSKLKEEVDKNVKFFYYELPTRTGELNSTLSSFIDEFIKLNKLKGYANTIEENKAANRWFKQKLFPELRPDQYEVFQNHTFLMNTNLSELDDPKKRFYNMHGVGRHIEYFEPEWKKRTEEMIIKYFNIRKFHEIDIDKKTGVVTVGELAKLEFLPIVEYGSLLNDTRTEFKDSLSEIYGVYQFSSQRQLKEQARLGGFSIRTSISKIQTRVEKCLSHVLNDMLESAMDYFARKKIEELILQNKEIPEEKDKIEIPDLDILKIISVELDPIQYLTESDQNILSTYNLSLGDIIKISFGSGVLDFIEGADTMYPVRGATQQGIGTRGATTTTTTPEEKNPRKKKKKEQ